MIFVILFGIVAMILLSAFFSGAEMALSGANRVRLENEAESGNRKAARALKLIDRYERTLSTILVGNNLVNIASSSLTTVFVILATGNDRLNYLATIFLTIMVILFGETIPKIAGKKNATSYAKSVAGPVSFFRILFMPVSAPVSWVTSLITRRIREEEPEDQEEESTAELQSIIDTAESEGVLDSDQSELVSAAIDFSDISADEAMTARVDVEGIDLEDDRETILKEIDRSRHSRLPVYRNSIDHIVGVVHLNHLLKALSVDRNAPIEPLVMKPTYVYRTMKLPQVLDVLKKARQHLAVVVDEYSGTLGVITMEDVLEEIVGDIWDETDEVEEEVVERGNGEFEIDGDMHVEDFAELVDVTMEELDCESETAGGLVIEKNGNFPKEGDVVKLSEGLTATVLEMEGLRVLKLLVRKEEGETTT